MKVNFTIPKRQWLWLWLLAAILSLPSESLFAQSLTVSGKVMDESNASVPGVSVVIKGTTNGTTTDETGKYVLQLSDGNATLVFSFIGYTTQEVPVNNRTQVDVSLQPDVQTLSEVVVVGYGTQRKAD